MYYKHKTGIQALKSLDQQNSFAGGSWPAPARQYGLTIVFNVQWVISKKGRLRFPFSGQNCAKRQTGFDFSSRFQFVSGGSLTASYFQPPLQVFVVYIFPTRSV
jgi:hypothetical protein